MASPKLQESIAARRGRCRTACASDRRRTRRSSSTASCAACGSWSSSRRRPSSRTVAVMNSRVRPCRARPTRPPTRGRARWSCRPRRRVAPRRHCSITSARHAISLAVHHVLGGIVDGHGLERVEADDELDPGDVDAASGNGRRATRGVKCRPAVGAAADAGLVGVDGLVALGLGRERRGCTAATASRRDVAATTADHPRRRSSPAHVSPASVRRPISMSASPVGVDAAARRGAACDRGGSSPPTCVGRR